MGAKGKGNGAGILADMHLALFIGACLLAAICGGALALFIDVILVGAYGTAGNFATPIIFLILFLVGIASPPTVLLWTRWEARRDHARLRAVEPKLATPPAPEEPKDAQAKPQEAKSEKDQPAQLEQKVAEEPQGSAAPAEPKTAQPSPRPSATLGPIIVEPVYVAQPRRRGSGILVASFVGVLTFAVGVILGGKERASFVEDIKSYATDRLRDLMQAAGVDTPADQAPAPDSELVALYMRLGIAPLPARLERAADINRGLTRLRQEACDNEAIFVLGEALRKNGNARVAANAYLGFAASCANGEGDKYAAANILYQLADYDRTISIMAEMISANPAVANYRYLRGAALVGLKRYDEALTDYANAIELSDNQRNIGEWVFLEMAAAYAGLKQYCAAITPIQTFVAIDPANRDNAKTRRLILDYSKQGNCELHYATGSDSFTHDSGNTIRTRVSVNGIDGTFVVDTGASFVVLTADFAMRAKVDVFRQSVPIDTANGRAESTLGRATTVRLGRRIEAADVPILIQNRSLGRDVDGLLGMSFLSRFDLSIGRRDWSLSPRK